MTQIQHVSPDSASIAHEGKTYASLGDGVFEVPYDVAKTLTHFSGQYRMYDGQPWPEPEPRTPEEKRAREIRDAVRRGLAEAAPPSDSKPKRARKAK